MTTECNHRHRTWLAAAECRWPRADWISGNGRFATISLCDHFTVRLHTTQGVAHKALEFIDRNNCGHHCTNRHSLYALSVERVTRGAVMGPINAAREEARLCGVPDTEPIPEELL